MGRLPQAAHSKQADGAAPFYVWMYMSGEMLGLAQAACRRPAAAQNSMQDMVRSFPFHMFYARI